MGKFRRQDQQIHRGEFWVPLAKLTRAGRYAYAAVATAIFAAVVWGFQAIDPSRREVAMLYAPSAAFWLVFVPFFLARASAVKSRPLAFLVGLLVVVPAGLSVVSMHSIAPHILLMLLAFIWIADIAAFFAGRAFGKRKLALSISPGKSWEGVWSGMLGVMLLAVLWLAIDRSGLVDSASLYTRLLKTHGIVGLVMVLIFLSAMSVVGDLVESLVKRSAGAKDSSGLLPGHGGVLDRVDALLPVFPLAMAMVSI